MIGLDMPAAFGLLSFLANFIPTFGAMFASICPCLLGLILRSSGGSVKLSNP